MEIKYSNWHLCHDLYLVENCELTLLILISSKFQPMQYWCAL